MSGGIESTTLRGPQLGYPHPTHGNKREGGLRAHLKLVSGVCLCAVAVFAACSGGQKQPGPNPDTPRLEKVYRTGKGLAMGFDGGVNFEKATDLTRELSTEIAIAADHVQTPQGKAVLRQ